MLWWISSEVEGRSEHNSQKNSKNLDKNSGKERKIAQLFFIVSSSFRATNGSVHNDEVTEAFEGLKSGRVGVMSRLKLRFKISRAICSNAPGTKTYYIPWGCGYITFLLETSDDEVNLSGQPFLKKPRVLVFLVVVNDTSVNEAERAKYLEFISRFIGTGEITINDSERFVT